MSLPSSTKNVESDSSIGSTSHPNTRSLLDEVYDRSGEIEEEFKKVMAQGAPVKVLRSQVIGALKFLENICANHEKLEQESNSNTIYYENIIKKLEEKNRSLQMENQELSSALNLKELNEYSTPQQGNQLNENSSLSIGTLEDDYGQRIPPDDSILHNEHYFFGGRKMAIDDDYQDDLNATELLAPDSDESCSDSTLPSSPVLKG